MFEAPAEASDEWGDSQADWDPFATRRGVLLPVESTEVVEPAMKKTLATRQLSVRFVSGLTTAMRAVIDGRTFEIEGVIDVGERHREHQVDLRELT